MFLIDFSRLVISFKVAIFRTWIHCGCTAQAERPATPARENMVAPARLKVGQTGLTAPARKLPHEPRPLRRLLQSRFFPLGGVKTRERWGPSIPRLHLLPIREEFRNDFLELLRRRFGTKRVHNNIVYNEYISHREHIHMNATQWETLTDFTKWLGREGLCKVDETPKGWYIQYIDRDPETIRRQLELEKKKKQDLDDEEKTAKFIQEQVRRGLEGKEQVGIVQRGGGQRSDPTLPVLSSHRVL